MSDRGLENKDDLLHLFADFANFGVISFGIIIQINGFVVTGTAVSVKEYLTALGNSFTDGLTRTMFQIAGTMTDEVIHHFGNDLKKKISEVAADMDEGERQPRAQIDDYIHLKNIKYVVPVEIPVNQADFPYWRFSLSDVTGWTLGTTD